jgi:hypothetical protein
MGRNRRRGEPRASENRRGQPVVATLDDKSESASRGPSAVYLGFSAISLLMFFLYYWFSQVAEVADISEVTEDPFLATCNDTAWEVAPGLTFEEVYSSKMQIEQANPADMSTGMMQAAFSIATLLAQLTATPGHGYMTHLFRHPDFRLVLATDVGDSDAVYRYYNSDGTHSIRLSPRIITDPELEKTLFHESHHGHKALVHAKGENPALFKRKPKHHPGTGYDRQAIDAKMRFRSLRSAVDKGDNRILKDLPRLLEQERKGSLSQKAATTLATYKGVIENYQPKRHFGVVNPSDSYRSPFTLADADRLKQAVDRGQIYKYQFRRGAHLLTMYVDKYEEMGNRLVLEGYGTPNRETDKATALMHDTEMRKFNLERTYAKGQYQPFGNVADTLLTEEDAHVAENDSELNEVFYPERTRFHNCEFNEVFVSRPRV